MVAASPLEVRASDKEEVLGLAAAYFGDPIDRELLLFEVDRDHVLRVSFDHEDNLVQLTVEPKCYFDEKHPDWEEIPTFTNLSLIDFQTLLTKLDLIRAKGALVRPASKVSFVTNLTAWDTSYYEKAVLTIGRLVDIRLPEESPVEIRWFRLDYGKVRRKS